MMLSLFRKRHEIKLELAFPGLHGRVTVETLYLSWFMRYAGQFSPQMRQFSPSILKLVSVDVIVVSEAVRSHP